MKWHKFAAAAALLTLAATAAQPFPALLYCDGTEGSTDLRVRVDGSSACQYLTPPDPSNTLTAVTVNAAKFFGNAAWTGVPGFSQVPGGMTGAWNLGTLNDDLEYMIVFKGGRGTNLIAFLITTAQGDWTTPFTAPPFDLPGKSAIHDAAQFSIFAHGSAISIPEPALVALLGLALLVLSSRSRPKR